MLHILNARGNCRECHPRSEADPMYKRIFLLVSPLIIVSLLTNFGPVTAVPTAVEENPTLPPVHVEIGQVPPYLVGQNPPEGQRLELSSAIEFAFDRDMKPAQTADAFTLRDAD